MGFVSKIVRTLAVRVHKQIEFMATHPYKFQDAIFNELINKGKHTSFGKEHNYHSIKSYEHYKKEVQLQSYEQDIRPYMDRVFAGEKNVLWPGRPKYVASTAGTAGGVKYIPLSKESIGHHFQTARNAVVNYALKYGMLSMFEGKLVHIAGGNQVEKIGGIPVGRLSGIISEQVPRWLKYNRLPSSETNNIVDWDEKIEKIIEESITENITMVSGLPPRVQMYLERLLERSGKESISELFPNLKLGVFGGVSFKPYKSRFQELLGADLDIIDTYPSTEGFIGFQDVQGDPSLLLNVNGGIFFEFVPRDQINSPSPDRISLRDVELHKDYVIIINNNAGLWASKLGDIVSFVSKDPHRIIIKGRTEHFISAFGEHVITQEVETALQAAMLETGIKVIDYTVAPEVNPVVGLPHHEWFMEFDRSYTLTELATFRRVLDKGMQASNFHYRELVQGKVIQPLEITELSVGTIASLRKSIKENLLPRVSNDRYIADRLTRRSIAPAC